MKDNELAWQNASHSLPKRLSVGDEVHQALLARLVSLRIRPEARIPIDALARELEVSQTPIRAALVRLEAEGLVVKKHNQGYFAAPLPSRQRYKEMYDVRLLLEPYAARHAASVISPEQLKRLRAAHHAMEELSRETNHLSYGKFATLDAQFHALIASAAGNTLITELLKQLYTHMHLVRLQFHAGITQDAIGEHAAIIQALEQGLPDAAAAAMQTHIENSRARLEPMFEALTQ